MNKLKKINFIKDNILFYNIPHEYIFEYIIKKNINYIENYNGVFFTIN